MKKALLFLVALPVALCAQGKPATPAPLPSVDSLLVNLKARALGPTTMGGRVTSLAVYEKEPRIFLVGAATGGVWETVNGGMTFQPIFYREGSSSIGAVAISQNDQNLIWVGTGEATSRNSVGWGDGIYKTTDGGKTWKKMGLETSYHISKILIDPKNDNIVYAGVLGMLWGRNEERGVYKSTDGGKTWKNLLKVDANTGVIDMAMDPSNNRVLLVAMYDRLRYPYNFVSGGAGSGIFRSTDAGASWHQINKGVPKGPLGRIGLSYFLSDPRNVVATIEAKEGTGTYKSKDGGETWAKASALDPRPFYFSTPRQDPNDPNRIYVPAVSLHYSIDGGKTFQPMRSSVHVDHHAMWIDPKDSNHMIIGEDGGVGQTRDRGATWEHLNYLNIGQFYAVAFDMRKPYWVYGGLQDNGCWAGPTQTTHGGVAFFDWYGIGGGDGFHVAADPNDWTTIYSESQGGAIERIDQKWGGGKFIQPQAPKGETYRMNWSTPFILSQFNSKTLYFGTQKLMKSVDRGDHWLAISPDLTENNPAHQKPGEGSVSPENTGAEAYDTIIDIGESPMKPGLIWVGTDDGNVQLTQDDGAHWANVTANIKDLPVHTWVSRVTPSRFVEGRAYATFDGHRNNDYATHVYVTEDFGKTWTKLNGNLPSNEPCYVIKEGMKNPDLLFLGTEFSLYISLDRGQNWTRYRANDFPTVPVHDVEIQPREEDLLIATHGRSLYILPIGALDELTKDNLQKDAYLAHPSNVYQFGRQNFAQWDGDRIFVSPDTQPGTIFCYYLKKDAAADAKITVTDPSGANQVASVTGTAKAGLNVAEWNARGRGRLLQPGDYRVDLKVDGKDYYSTVRVEEVTDEQNASGPRPSSSSNGVEDEMQKPKTDDQGGG